MKRLLCAAVVLGAAADAHAFGISLVNGNKVRWPSSTAAFELEEGGTPDITSDIAAINSAVASWNDVACSTVVLTQTGTTSSTICR